jgi:hypothetical protein
VVPLRVCARQEDLSQRFLALKQKYRKHNEVRTYPRSADEFSCVSTRLSDAAPR